MVSNQITKTKKASFSAYMSNEAVKKQINEIVGKNAEKFTASIVSAVSTNPALQKCTSSSILSAALLGQTLNLSPSPQLGYYYFVPYEDRKNGTTQAQFQMGYKGIIQLAIRSGQYRKINVLAIKEGELKRFDPINEEIEVEIISDPDARETAETCGYYAFFETMNGFRKSMYWSKRKMTAHAEKYSPGFRAHKGYTFWEKAFDEMAYKTMIRQLLGKWGIMSIEMQTAHSADMTYGDTVANRSFTEENDFVEVYAEEPEEQKEPEQASAEQKQDDDFGAFFN